MPLLSIQQMLNFLKMKTVNFLGVTIDNVTWDETCDRICQLVQKKEPSFVVTPNVDHIVRLQNDGDFLQIYQEASLVLADGMPLLWGSRFLGQPIKEKISGSDLVPKCAALAAEKGLKLFFLGGREGAALGAKAVLKKRHPELKVVDCYSPPFGFEKDAAENEKIVRLIKRAKPDILFVGLGSPKQENWISKYHQEIEVPVSIGIGVTFEFIAGMVKRAPVWMQKCSLEWFWRLIMEPRRLWRRYLVDDMQFFLLILREKIRGNSSGK